MQSMRAGQEIPPGPLLKVRSDMSEIILETKKLSKSFSGVFALKDFDFTIKKGEIRAVVGENGAGKSTLIQTLVGAHKPDYGDIILNGERVTFSSPTEANACGISAVFQELSVVDNLSIAENIFINRQPTFGPNLVNSKKLYENTAVVLKQFNMEHINPRTLLGELSVANKQQVEILKAMSYDPKIMILDEPTSSLTDVEVKMLHNNLRVLRDQGVSLIYISHHLNEIFEVCDTITVMRDGLKVCDANVAGVDEGFLISKMVGREIDDIYGGRGEDPIGGVVLEVENISRQGNFRDISFNVRKGEIVAFSGLVGAGRTEVGLSLFGIDRIDSGEVRIDGGKVDIKSPTEAMRHGIGYVTEDRKKDGLYLNHSIKMNTAANKLGRFSHGVIMNDREIRKNAEDLKESFNVVSRDVDQVMVSLSGGNQQKVLLAEWFDTAPKILIIDEPTRGVDVGSKFEIYNKIRDLARRGAAVVVISSDLMEVLGISDRIIVMKNGMISGELSAAEATEELVLSYALTE